jgi:hypothetical protein
VATWGADGAQRWARRWGNAAIQEAHAVAVTAAGEVVVGGEFGGTIQVDPGDPSKNLTSTGEQDAFVIKLDPDGAPLWGVRFGGLSWQSVRSLAVDGAGNIVAGGQFQGIMTIGADTHSWAGAEDLFLAKLSPDGEVLWSQAFGGEADDALRDLVVGPGGRIYFTGELAGPLALGGELLENSPGTPVKDDFYIAVLDPEGAHLYSARFGEGTAHQQAQGIAVLGCSVAVAGSFGATFPMGSTDVALPGTSTWSFVARLTPWLPP